MNNEVVCIINGSIHLNHNAVRHPLPNFEKALPILNEYGVKGAILRNPDRYALASSYIIPLWGETTINFNSHKFTEAVNKFLIALGVPAGSATFEVNIEDPVSGEIEQHLFLLSQKDGLVHHFKKIK